MKKGELRKQEILQTAEQLFCRNGYEQTSIQDILDQLHTSKGSFYHHFVSKDALLETMCSKRAEHSLELTLADHHAPMDAAGRINRLLTGMIPLQGEKLAFILMILPILFLPEGRTLKISYCESLRNNFFCAVRDTIREGKESGKILCGDPDVYADLVITLSNRLWVSVCDMIIESEQKGESPDISELLHYTEQYRTAVERILTIPYGSMVLIDIPSMKDLADQIHLHWQHR